MRFTTHFFSAGLCLVSLLSATCKCSFVTDEETLRADLLSNYSIKVRPALQTQVDVGMMISSLSHLDTARQSMSLVTIFILLWSDPRLAWNPANYGGLTYLVTAPEDIWTPPLVAENAIDDVGVIGGASRDGAPLKIDYTGSIQWTPLNEIITACDMAISHYPFDTQRCAVVLIGWSYPVSGMNTTATIIDTTTMYYKNGEFDLIDTRAYGTEVSQANLSSDTYRKLNFELTFRRKWEFYGQNLMLPIMLNSFLMSMVFVLPIETGNKMGYSLTMFLTYIVFLTWVTDNLPPISTDTSILQVYLATVLVMGGIATVLTMWVLHLYHTDPNKPMGKIYRAIASKVLVPFSDCIHCQRKTKTRVEDVDDCDQELPASATRNTYLTEHGHASNISLHDPKSALEGSEPATKEDDKRKTTPTYTWQELAELCDCFFLWTFASVMVILNITVLSLLYGNY